MNPTPSGSGCRLSSKLWRAQLARDAVLRHQPRPAGAAEPDEHLDALGQADVVGARGQHRAAERDDAGHQVGAAYGEPAGEHPAQAVPDDLHPGAAPQRDRLEAALQLRGGVEGAAGVDVDATSGRCGSPARAAPAPSGPACESPARKPGTRITGVACRMPARAAYGDRRRSRRRSSAPSGEPAGLPEGAGLAQHRSDARSGESLRRQPGCQRRCRHAYKVTQR